MLLLFWEQSEQFNKNVELRTHPHPRTCTPLRSTHSHALTRTHTHSHAHARTPAATCTQKFENKGRFFTRQLASTFAAAAAAAVADLGVVFGNVDEGGGGNAVRGERGGKMFHPWPRLARSCFLSLCLSLCLSLSFPHSQLPDTHTLSFSS